MKRSIALLAVGALCLACNLPELTVKLPAMCRTVQGLTLPPGSGLRETISAHLDQSFDLAAAGLGQDAQFEARLTSLRFTARAGATLDWVEEASATLHGPQGAALPDVAFRYDRVAGAAPATSITVPGSDADLAPYLAGGQVSADLAFTGTLPPEPAVVDVKLCFELTALFPL